MHKLLNGSKRAEAAQMIADTGERIIKQVGGVSTALAVLAAIATAALALAAVALAVVVRRAS